MEDSLRAACMVKYRDIIQETMSEYTRKGSFVRIYPSKNSYLYDQFFQGPRPLNKILYKVLYSDKVLNIGRGMSTTSPTKERDDNEDNEEMVEIT